MVSPRVLRVRQGYSLIELVVVLMILAIVAGLTVSLVDWLRRSADKSAAANIMASLLSNIQLFRTAQGVYPDQFDSLTDTAGAPYEELGSDLKGILAFQPLTADQVASLTKVGIANAMDHVKGSGSEGFPSNSGTVQRPIATGGTFAVLSNATVRGNAVIDSIYPPKGGVSGSGLPTDVTLVVFGFGPANTANGSTIASPPLYSGAGDLTKVYARFAVVFAVYDPRNGRRAQVKGVLDSKGDFLSQELAEFYQNTPK